MMRRPPPPAPRRQAPPPAQRCVEINQCVGCTRQFFTKSFLGDGSAVLARSSGEETGIATPSSRYHEGVEDDDRAVKF